MQKLVWTAVGLLMAASSASAQDIKGDWRLVSSQTVIDGEAPKDLYGATPKGFLSLSPGGRMIVLITGAPGDVRLPGAVDAERAALHKSMIAYIGTYTSTEKEFVTTVDASWVESWNGSEQRRFYNLVGDKLTIDTAPQPSMMFPGKTSVARLVWERVK